jgi:hypothetical protein
MPWSSHDDKEIKKFRNNGTSPRKLVDAMMNDNNTRGHGQTWGPYYPVLAQASAPLASCAREKELARKS